MDFKLTTTLLICAVCWTACSSLTQQNADPTNINEIIQQFNALTERFEDLEKNNQALQTKVDTLETQLKAQQDSHLESEKFYKTKLISLNEMLRTQHSWNAKRELSAQQQAKHLESLEENCLQQIKQISDIHGNRKRQVEEQQPVAFYAALRNSISHIGHGQNIIFNNATLNIGDNYIPSHGIFVAPVNGIYVFSTTLMTESHTDTHAAIYINEKLATWLKLYGTEHQYDTMSQTAIYQLNKGDAVAVKHTEADKSFHGQYTYFSGFLLQQIYTTGSIIG